MENMFHNPQKLSEAIGYQTGAIVSRAVIQNDKGSITLFSFDSGQGLSEHTAPFDAFVVVAEGALDITVGGKTATVESGSCVVMPAHIPHAVNALQKTKMLLVMIKG